MFIIAQADCGGMIVNVDNVDVITANEHFIEAHCGKHVYILACYYTREEAKEAFENLLKICFPRDDLHVARIPRIYYLPEAKMRWIDGVLKVIER